MKTETITLIKYSATNTYLIEGECGAILFDTGWAGTFPAFCAELGRNQKQLKKIDYILISHFHPDHCGIAQEIADHSGSVKGIADQGGSVKEIADQCGSVKGIADHSGSAKGIADQGGSGKEIAVRIGSAENIADQGAVILVPMLQVPFLHASDPIFAKERALRHVPIRDDEVRVISLEESRKLLSELGIAGELLHTPGHSEDSISLWLDQGALFVGDLNPLYELELHQGTQIEESWKRLLARKPKQVYYGHAKTAVLEADLQTDAEKTHESGTHHDAERSYGSEKDSAEWYDLVSRIMKMIDRKKSFDQIVRKTGADPSFVEDVTRMYLTHTNVGVQGILDRIEIKNR